MTTTELTLEQIDRDIHNFFTGRIDFSSQERPGVYIMGTISGIAIRDGNLLVVISLDANEIRGYRSEKSPEEIFIIQLHDVKASQSPGGIHIASCGPHWAQIRLWRPEERRLAVE